jgi:hypothetical protein
MEQDHSEKRPCKQKSVKQERPNIFPAGSKRHQMITQKSANVES